MRHAIELSEKKGTLQFHLFMLYDIDKVVYYAKIKGGIYLKRDDKWFNF